MCWFFFLVDRIWLCVWFGCCCVLIVLRWLVLIMGSVIVLRWCVGFKFEIRLWMYCFKLVVYWVRIMFWIFWFWVKWVIWCWCVSGRLSLVGVVFFLYLFLGEILFFLCLWWFLFIVGRFLIWWEVCVKLIIWVILIVGMKWLSLWWRYCFLVWMRDFIFICFWCGWVRWRVGLLCMSWVVRCWLIWLLKRCICVIWVNVVIVMFGDMDVGYVWCVNCV